MIAAVHGPPESRALDVSIAVVAVGSSLRDWSSPAFDQSQGIMFSPWPQVTAERMEWDDEQSYAARPRPATTRSFLQRLWEPSARWGCETAADYTDRDALGVGYLRFRYPVRWWLAADMLCALIIVMLRGLAPLTNGGCTTVMWVAVAVSVIALLLAGARPFLHEHKNIALILVSLLTLTASILGAVGQVRPALVVLTVVEAIVMIAIVLAVVQRCQRIHRQMKMRDEKKAAVQREQERKAAEKGDDVFEEQPLIQRPGRAHDAFQPAEEMAPVPQNAPGAYAVLADHSRVAEPSALAAVRAGGQPTHSATLDFDDDDDLLLFGTAPAAASPARVAPAVPPRHLALHEIDEDDLL